MSRGLDRPEIIRKLVAVLEDMIEDWDLDFDRPLGDETRIVADLGFESVDLMQLIVAIDQVVGSRNLPFDEVLMEDGGYVNEITIGRLADFIVQATGKTDS